MVIDPLKTLRDIGNDISVALNNGAYAGAIILTYAAIDAMSFLSMPMNQKEVQGRDFINWVEKYMRTDPNQPYQYNGIDLFGARCGIVHRYGATSRLSDSGESKIFQYHNGGNHIYKPDIHENLVAISWSRLIADFFSAMDRFLGDIMNDTALNKRVASRINHLFQVSPI